MKQYLSFLRAITMSKTQFYQKLMKNLFNLHFCFHNKENEQTT